jgi:beta-glucosidase
VLEPKEGEFDESYIEKYRSFIIALKSYGIEPMLTIHHFANPQWFIEKGGFEKEENIEGFVRFADKMVSCFAGLVTHWITINEPAVYTFQAYLKGLYPPGCKNFHLTGKVLINLLKAHIKIYERLKPKYPHIQVGISHNFLWVEAYSPLHPIERAVSHYFSEITHNALFRFFQTGVYTFQIPFLANHHWEEPKIKTCLDFIGVQYYVTPMVKIGLFSAKSVGREGEKIMSLGARFYPEGLDAVLSVAGTLNKPIWITETGCDIDQSDYFTKAFSIMSHSIAKGIDLRGVLIWTIRDNLEWERGDAVKIGLFHGNFEEKPVVNEVIRPLFKSQA